MTDWQLDHARCEDWLPQQADASADLILVDPPYFRVKDEPWDRQWETAAGFLAWLDGLAAEWQRILKPNGSLYVFASPQMAARIEVLLGERFNVLNHIIWRKTNKNGNDAGWHQQTEKEALRLFFPASERVIFAEQQGADAAALGESTYAAKCDELRGFVFEPLRAYFAAERDRCGIPSEAIMAGMAARGQGRYSFARHTFTRSQWELPTEAAYLAARDLFNTYAATGEYLRRDYEELRRDYEELRRDYEELRRDYEELRRPFFLTAAVPFTDTWDFATVAAYPGKHPCEKPLPLLRHIISSSSRPGALVLDCFAGSGNTGIAARQLGRRFIGCEASATWHTRGGRRIADAALQGALPLAGC